ncbi:dihydrofolate reductase family protein [Bdellovibrio bacteriovorus]|uniref:dihydrofolate reductase family protein n=1 Tax=Bdellovibrio bacteriovorus TaxID=959 RepID=UPI0035A73DFB
MREIVTSAFMSIDGVIQAPGGPDEDPSGGFKFGGWVAPHWDDTLGASLDEIFSSPFDLLLGRKTYDIFAAYWPYIGKSPSESKVEDMNSEIAKRFNACNKFVATHRPDSLTWQNSHWLGKDTVATLRELKKSDGPMLLTQGSADFIQTLFKNDLVDQIRLYIFPITLGKGKRLFADGTQPGSFELTNSSVSPSGVIIANYRRAGNVETGSFATENPSAAELERRKNLK